MAIKYEAGYDDKILQFLRNKGHKLEQYPEIITGFASVIAIAKRNGKIEAAVDERRGGSFGFV